jgi:glycosyltransferase involved in cell wall biosynthesis
MRATPIDIVVPVYNAAADLARCVDSVLEHSTGDWRLLLIDDASPDPAIRAYFSGLRARRLLRVTLLANEKNIGFTLTANRSFAEARREADIAAAGSFDARLARLVIALRRVGRPHRHHHTALNNAEICSPPRFCANNPWPPGGILSRWSPRWARAVPTYPDLPTGVGFCLYIRRPLTTRSRTTAFGPGYGERLRLRAGGRLSERALRGRIVLHLAARSARSAHLAERNMALLLERHPHYLDLVRSYIAADPVRGPLRELATSQQRVLTDRHGILHPLHGHAAAPNITCARWSRLRPARPALPADRGRRGLAAGRYAGDAVIGYDSARCR